MLVLLGIEDKRYKKTPSVSKCRRRTLSNGEYIANNRGTRLTNNHQLDVSLLYNGLLIIVQIVL